MQNEFLTFDFNNEEHINTLLNEAKDRKGIFETNNKTSVIDIFNTPNEILDKTPKKTQQHITESVN